jgi:hypothetical protein
LYPPRAPYVSRMNLNPPTRSDGDVSLDASASITKYNAAKQALAAAHDIDEVKGIYDKAVALRVYAMQAKDRVLIDHATEIRLRAERRAGELLKKMEKHRGGGERGVGRRGVKNAVVTGDRILKLSDLSINKTQSSKWQKLADTPDDKFEELVNRAKQKASAAISKCATVALLSPATVHRLASKSAPQSKGEVRSDKAVAELMSKPKHQKKQDQIIGSKDKAIRGEKMRHRGYLWRQVNEPLTTLAEMPLASDVVRDMALNYDVDNKLPSKIETAFKWLTEFRDAYYLSPRSKPGLPANALNTSIGPDARWRQNRDQERERERQQAVSAAETLIRELGIAGATLVQKIMREVPPCAVLAELDKLLLEVDKLP